jgi:anti-anti-sigma factor
MQHSVNLFSYERHGDTLVVVPAVNLSEFDFAVIDREVHSLLEFLEASRVSNVVVDFQHTSYFGSTAIKALLRIGDQVREKHGTMVLCNLSPGEHQILDVAHLGSHWTIAGSREEALKSLELVAKP